MVRISKQAERRAKCPHRPRVPGLKTGPKPSQPKGGFKQHLNSVDSNDLAYKIFIPKKIG